MDFTNLKGFLDDFTEKYLPGSDCLVLKGSEPVFRNTIGYAGDEAFNIYSMSKIFTCTAALQLLEKGKYTLKDRLCEYLPEFDERILVGQLFSMTAGLDYDLSFAESFRDTDASTREVISALAKRPLVYPPGEQWIYSLAHDVLGAFIEVISGQKFSEYMEEHILSPLGMARTGFRLKEGMTLAPQYVFDPVKKAPVLTGSENQFVVSRAFESGGAGIISTMDDLAKFYPVLTMGGTSPDGVRILAPVTVGLMRKNVLSGRPLSMFQRDDHVYDGYGYGLGVRTFIDPAASGSLGSVGEFGWSGAAAAHVIMDPANELTLIFLTHVLDLGPEHRIRMRNSLYSCL